MNINNNDNNAININEGETINEKTFFENIKNFCCFHIFCQNIQK